MRPISTKGGVVEAKGTVSLPAESLVNAAHSFAISGGDCNASSGSDRIPPLLSVRRDAHEGVNSCGMAGEGNAL